MTNIHCPICGTAANSYRMDMNPSSFVGCPDGYDVIESEFIGFPILVPRSGRTEKVYVAGKTSYSLVPCGCPVAGIKALGDGTFEVIGNDKDSKPVTITGTFRFIK